MEDDLEISELVSRHLKGEGFDIVAVNDGEKALQAFYNNTFDLILLDLMLPKVSGKEILKRIRESSSVPVLIVSAKDSEVDKILGLELGADDYIAKPFSVLELTARISAIFRRIGYYIKEENSTKSISRGPFTLNFDNYQILKGEDHIDLTAKEFELLKLFFENPKKVFTKAQIFASVWKGDFINDDNTVTVQIRRLREKIEEDPSNPKYIKTVWGIGYRLGDT
ncbi:MULTISPECIES: response regulator transcription factor [Clostridium]|uniref:response regulator transcription factor n=1 Tax=Clostridium TaxID=1485 RepID=UPI0028F726C7|nr:MULTISPECIES: response regulator transcription factor [unclassified Clostridium]